MQRCGRMGTAAEATRDEALDAVLCMHSSTRVVHMDINAGKGMALH